MRFQSGRGFMQWMAPHITPLPPFLHERCYDWAQHRFTDSKNEQPTSCRGKRKRLRWKWLGKWARGVNGWVCAGCSEGWVGRTGERIRVTMRWQLDDHFTKRLLWGLRLEKVGKRTGSEKARAQREDRCSQRRISPATASNCTSLSHIDLISSCLECVHGVTPAFKQQHKNTQTVGRTGGVYSIKQCHTTTVAVITMATHSASHKQMCFDHRPQSVSGRRMGQWVETNRTGLLFALWGATLVHHNSHNVFWGGFPVNCCVTKLLDAITGRNA